MKETGGVMKERGGIGPYRSRKKPDMLARARWCDYRARRIYMVTFSICSGMPKLARISGTLTSSGPVAEVALTPIGKIVDEQIVGLRNFYPKIRILAHVVMPDHIHFVIFVTENTGKSLGDMVSSLKRNCLRVLRERYPDHPLAQSTDQFFIRGFNDKIVYKTGQKEAFVEYVRRNPANALIKQLRPDFFSRCQDVVVGEHQCESYGNFMLLRHPIMIPVRVSSKYSSVELNDWYGRWDETIRQGGVLVGPFISPREKEVRDRAIECGASVIWIRWYGYENRGHPSETMYRLCAEGRLLVLALHPFITRREALTRPQCLAMNELAETLCRERLAARLRHGRG